MSTGSSDEPQPHRPGDVVDGYVLGSDGRWLPLAKEPRGPFGRYMERWRRRWLKTVLVVTLVEFLLAMLFVAGGVGRAGRRADDVSWLWIAYNVIAAGLLYGTLINVVVALPRRREPPRDLDGPPGSQEA